MLSNYVGEPNFLKGVSIYLKNHLYANSVTKDLWDGITEASGLWKQPGWLPLLSFLFSIGVDVGKMMNNWVSKVRYAKFWKDDFNTLQMGFPVIIVDETKDGIHVQ